MSYVLGVDGGTTKTVALVARLDGTIVGAGRGGCANIYGACGADAALSAVAHAVTAALSAAGVPAGALLAGAFSMSGADWPEDMVYLREVMARRGFGATVLVVNDALGALRAGSPDGTGVAVVCGTGAAIGARAADGRAWHSGFWAEPGGSHDLARKTLRAVYRAELGIDPPTTLTARVLALFEQPCVEDVLHLLTARGGEPLDWTGHLTRAVLDEAHNGDPVARRVVQEQGVMLGDYALAAARRVHLEHALFPLVLAGGVLRHPSRLLADTIVARVQRAAPGAQLVRSRFEPAIGALFLALEAVGVAVDERVREHLVPTLPPGTLFDT